MCDYYDFFETRPYSETISGKATKQKITINFKDKYHAIELMNQIDIDNVKRGNNILNFLLDFKCGSKCSEEKKQEILVECVREDKKLVYHIVNRKQYGYYSLLNFYIQNNPSKFSCFNILLHHNANCINIFSNPADPVIPVSAASHSAASLSAASLSAASTTISSARGNSPGGGAENRAGGFRITRKLKTRKTRKIFRNNK